MDLTIPEATGTLGTIIGLMVTWFTRHKLAVPLIKAVTDYVRSRARAPREIARIAKTLDELLAQTKAIQAELKFNGGSSLRDEVRLLVLRQAIRPDLNREPLMTFDTSGALTWVSRSAQRAFGVTLDELMGKSWVSTIAHADKERVMREWDYAMRDQREVDLTFRLRDSNHEVSMQVLPMRARGGQCHGWEGRISVMEEAA